MKISTRLFVTIVTSLVVTACAPTASPPPASDGGDPYAPQPGDAALQRGEIRIISSSIAVAESYPVQVMVSFDYFPTTTCHKLRVEASEPDAQKQIQVSAYDVAPKDQPCTLMALATPLHANMNLGSFPKGHYSVWLNEAKVGEFDA